MRFRLRAEIIVGRATPTIVPSKMMRESPAARMARAFQRPGKGWAAVAEELASDTAFLSTLSTLRRRWSIGIDQKVENLSYVQPIRAATVVLARLILIG